MSGVPQSAPRVSATGVRAFTAFVALQCAVAALILFPEDGLNYALIGLGAVGAVVWGALLPVYPWLSIPVLVGTTSLDISGRLVQKTPIGIPITGFHLGFLMMILGLLAHVALRRRIRFPRFELAAPLALLLGLIALSLTWSPNQPEATISFMRTLMLVVFLYLTQILIDSRAAVNCAVLTLAVCTVAASILGIVQMLTEEFFLPASFVLAAGANTPRAVGTFHNPNHFGTFLMAGSLLMLGVAINGRWPRIVRFVLLASAGIGLAGLLATFSRSNWVAITVGGLFLLSVSGKLKLRYLFGAVFGISILLVALQSVLPIAEYIVTRVVSIFALFSEFGSKAHVSGSARVQFVQAAFGMWADNPLFGAGWRAFPVILDLYKPDDFPHWIPTRESHTLFATIIAELGLAGIVASVWLVGRIMSRSMQALRVMEDANYRAVLIALLSVFVGFQVSLTFTNDFTNNFLWFFTGMIFAVIRLEQQQREAGSTG